MKTQMETTVKNISDIMDAIRFLEKSSITLFESYRHTPIEFTSLRKTLEHKIKIKGMAIKRLLQRMDKQNKILTEMISKGLN